ncbi:MAG: RecQ family ATP-dependent DNA helicase, partial [Paramuribaculum sp.]|nr:RecQ family ATP-dependent DNA helicase [Paramuribaculum sp.]
MEPLELLRKYWGYDSFREPQDKIIESVLEGHDTLGLLPTGGGKSITFQIPALILPGLTLVVTPLISLMKDQVDNLMARGIRAAAIHSGLSRAEVKLAFDRCALGKIKMLYISPERLQTETFIDNLRSMKIDVSLIVVDESHCISQWGYDFRPSYLHIATLRKVFPDAPVLALTASATEEVQTDIQRLLRFRPDSRTFSKSFSRPNITFVVRKADHKPGMLRKVLSSTAGSTIVYVRSRRRCSEIADEIRSWGISADYYHAGLSIEEKNERQNAWQQSKNRVIVATNAFGMGIDKPDVRT